MCTLQHNKYYTKRIILYLRFLGSEYEHLYVVVLNIIMLIVFFSFNNHDSDFQNINKLNTDALEKRNRL